jgi:hypothetical protein
MQEKENVSANTVSTIDPEEPIHLEHQNPLYLLGHLKIALYS